MIWDRARRASEACFSVALAPKGAMQASTKAWHGVFWYHSIQGRRGKRMAMRGAAHHTPDTHKTFWQDETKQATRRDILDSVPAKGEHGAPTTTSGSAAGYEIDEEMQECLPWTPETKLVLSSRTKLAIGLSWARPGALTSTSVTGAGTKSTHRSRSLL